MNLFTHNTKKLAPLSDRMRATTLQEFLGQEHLIYDNSFLLRAIRANTLGSCIFYGPPGTGKTTIAHIISNITNATFKKLNAVSSGVGEAKAIIEEAKNNLELYGKKTYLLLDECHRWSKAQSDSVLQAIEQGWIVFIGSTTENPYVSMTRAIISRVKVFEFKPLSTENILKGLKRALSDKDKGYGGYKIVADKDALKYLAINSGGDLRQAYNALELAVLSNSQDSDGTIHITKQVAQECVQNKGVAIDETSFYDLLSAFGKSIRGSDTDAALFYSQRLLASGCDARVIARRLIAHVSEDIGMADSNAALLAHAAWNAVVNLGMPEADLVLSHAIVYACEAEKSNSVYVAMHEARKDAKSYKSILIPNNIKNHPVGYNDNTGSYKYPHNFGGYVKQVYMPKELKDKIYYVPSSNGKEKGITRKKSKFYKLDKQTK